MASIRLAIQVDGSARLTTSCLERPQAADQSLSSEGVSWSDSVRVSARAGQVDTLDGEGIRLADIRVIKGNTGLPGDHMLSVVIPTGADTQWPKQFAPARGAERARIRAVLDPEGKSKKLGAVMKIEVKLPYFCDRATIVGTERGLKSKISDRVATLVLDLDKLHEESGQRVWRLSWNENQKKD